MNSIKKIFTIIKSVRLVKKVKTLIGIDKKKADNVDVKSHVIDTSNHDWEQYNDNVSF
jgi:hypothetical protein